MQELKWLIPVAGSVGIALLTLHGSKIDQIPWSRAFVIVGSLLLASLPLISYGKLGKDGLEVRAITTATVDANEAIGKLAARVTANEGNLKDLQLLTNEMKTAVTNEQAKAKIDILSKSLAKSVVVSDENKRVFDDVKTRLDTRIRSLPKL